MATVLRPNQKAKAVKNLGWLLNNWKTVKFIGFDYSSKDKRLNDGQLIAKMRDGATYLTDFASLFLCWRWLDRPIFRGVRFSLVKVNQDGTRHLFRIGDARWREIKKLEHKEFIKLIESL